MTFSEDTNIDSQVWLEIARRANICTYRLCFMQCPEGNFIATTGHDCFHKMAKCMIPKFCMYCKKSDPLFKCHGSDSECNLLIKGITLWQQLAVPYFSVPNSETLIREVDVKLNLIIGIYDLHYQCSHAQWPPSAAAV